MKFTSTTLAAGVTCAAGLLAAALSANAIPTTTIDHSRVFAVVDPGDPTSAPQDTAELTYILTTLYGKGTGTYPVQNPSWGSGNKPYEVTITTLPGMTVNDLLNETGAAASGTQFDINLKTQTYDYLMVKWDNHDVFYNIEGLTGSLDVVNDVVLQNGNAQGASDYKLFNASSVPDGGTTLSLLGFGLVAVETLRRKLGRC